LANGATVVGVTAGLGELLGYALRFVSGRIADRTGRYWAVRRCVRYAIMALNRRFQGRRENRHER